MQNFPLFLLYALLLHMHNHFRDGKSIPYSKLLALTLSPFFNPTVDPPIRAAFEETSIISSILQFSTSIIDVIIFVREAIGLFSLAFLSYNILPLSLSITTADGLSTFKKSLLLESEKIEL